jgi:hypothetical protein
MKRVTRSPPSKDVVSAPTFEDVARFVAGPDAPVWLVAHFKRWAKSLVVDRFLEEKQPAKVAMKRQLDDVKDAALLLRRALSDTPTREFLEIVPQDRIKYGGVIDHMLQDLATRAERAMGSPALSRKDGKTKAGRTKGAPLDASSAKLFCAALIAEAWKYFHDTDPPPRNQDAARAADAYWRASGGETNSWTVPLNGWRPYFHRVQEPSLAAVRAECRRHLIEAAHRG